MKIRQRCSGLVLHFTSLPGPHGSGDFGPDALRFADWLADAGQTLWQHLPLNPPGYGDSPYQAKSAFAGNPLLVALEPLVALGWLVPPEPPAAFASIGGRVDFGAVGAWRLAQLRAAHAGFEARADAAQRAALAAWCSDPAQQAWLPDYTLFMAVHGAQGQQPWWDWPAPLRDRDPAALAAARTEHAAELRFQAFVQWCFDTQLAALKAHANARGVALMGDLPIFIAHDSADCWSRPDLYRLDAQGQPTVVAGVPPDGYSPDGQRWGNPLYRWQRMADEGYAWWIARMGRMLHQADVFRVDHFRGFAGCWEIPAACPTARDGHWASAPGVALFAAIEAALGRLPIVAEDLGLITPDVIALRDRFGFPGMRIVYEGFFGDASHSFLPHHHQRHGLVYSSTHDSDTVRGFWDAATPAQRDFAAAYLGLEGLAPDEAAAQVAAAVVRATFTSVADLALVPLQDLLGAGSDERMNRPGTAAGNWGWRCSWARLLADDIGPRLLRLTRASGR
jgi:4-alpha-glucanotransferase